MNRSVGRPETATAASTALGPGMTRTSTPGGGRGHDEPVSRVAHGRHAGVAQHQHILIARQGDQFGRALLLVVVVQGDQPRAVRDAEPAEKPLRRARVFGRDHRGGLERLDQPPRRVAEIADRGRGEDDHPPTLGWSL